MSWNYRLRVDEFGPHSQTIHHELKAVNKEWFHTGRNLHKTRIKRNNCSLTERTTNGKYPQCNSKSCRECQLLRLCSPFRISTKPFIVHISKASYFFDLIIRKLLLIEYQYSDTDFKTPKTQFKEKCNLFCLNKHFISLIQIFTCSNKEKGKKVNIATFGGFGKEDQRSSSASRNKFSLQSDWSSCVLSFSSL